VSVDIINAYQKMVCLNKEYIRADLGHVRTKTAVIPGSGFVLLYPSPALFSSKNITDFASRMMCFFQKTKMRYSSRVKCGAKIAPPNQRIREVW
jgi:hypothetical protein